MTFCQQCGKKLSRGAKFCATCEAMCEADSRVPTAPEPATPRQARTDVARQAPTLSQISRMPAFREITSRLQSEKDIQFMYDEGNATFPGSTITVDGKVSVDDLLRTLASAPIDRQAGLIVALTDRDLARPGCGSLFGYADPSRRICIVSTARLGATVEEITPRLENVIRHELGHLEGLRHCHQTGCLMEAAMKPEDLDRRSGDSCSECRRRLLPHGSRVLHRVAAVILLVAVLVSMNLVAALLEPAPHEPFAFSPLATDANLPEGASATERALIFDGTPLIAPSLVTNPVGAAAELNRLFQLVEPPKLSAAAENADDLAAIVSGKFEIMRIHDPEAPAKASRIAAKLNAIIEFKGTNSSRCADCHRDRKDEVVHAAARRQAGFGIGPF